jgi:hypothetical protein
MAIHPNQVATFLDWFKTCKYAEYYKDEIAGVEQIYAIMDEITREVPAAEDVCQRIKNRYNLGFYNELKEDHKKYVDKNSPSLERKIIQED